MRKLLYWSHDAPVYRYIGLFPPRKTSLCDLASSRQSLDEVFSFLRACDNLPSLDCSPLSSRGRKPKTLLTQAHLTLTAMHAQFAVASSSASSGVAPQLSLVSFTDHHGSGLRGQIPPRSSTVGRTKVNAS